MNIYILYEDTTYINTVRDYLGSFKKYSKNNIYYVNYKNKEDIIKMSQSKPDAIIIFYSLIHRLGLSYTKKSCRLIVNTLSNISCMKACIIQDEYYDTNRIINFLKFININIIFTCIPDKYIKKIYHNLQNVQYHHILTGYIPELKQKEFIKIKDRKIDIFYRGKLMHYIYGDLGQDKMNIGIKMKEYCSNILNCNIEWNNEKRIYGDDWFKYLENSRVTLGTESGSNIFDCNGSLIKKINKYIKVPNSKSRSLKDMKTSYSYEHIRYKFKMKEGNINMGQISPKMFEAICHKTGLVMFEGGYSGILKPNIHYIPLKKNFSNINDVILKIKDNEYLQNMVDKTYEDIVKSEKYSYKTFIGKIDNIFSNYK